MGRTPKVIDEAAALEDAINGMSANALKFKYRIGTRRADEIVSQARAINNAHAAAEQEGELYETGGQESDIDKTRWALDLTVQKERVDDILRTASPEEAIEAILGQDADTKAVLLQSILQKRLDDFCATTTSLIDQTYLPGETNAKTRA